MKSKNKGNSGLKIYVGIRFWDYKNQKKKKKLKKSEYLKKYLIHLFDTNLFHNFKRLKYPFC